MWHTVGTHILLGLYDGNVQGESEWVSWSLCSSLGHNTQHLQLIGGEVYVGSQFQPMGHKLQGRKGTGGGIAEESHSHRGGQAAECKGRSQKGSGALLCCAPSDPTPPTRPPLLAASQL